MFVFTVLAYDLYYQSDIIGNIGNLILLNLDIVSSSSDSCNSSSNNNFFGIDNTNICMLILVN